MTFLRLLPIFLSALVLGAHFLRDSAMALAIFSSLIPFLLLLKRSWVARLIQVFLALGALEWIRALLLLIAERNAMGQPWTRMAII